jgi:hypothetical protein
MQQFFDDKRDVKDWFREGIDAYRQKLQLLNYRKGNMFTKTQVGLQLKEPSPIL